MILKDYIRRILIAGIMLVCVSLLFLGGKSAKAESTNDWMWPAEGVITDTFGTRNGHHKGIDIAAEPGTPVHSVEQGTVAKSYYSDSYGNVVFIRHENQTETIYAHLQNRYVQEGQKVARGETIGTMGNTGDSSGVHLHFELHQKEWTYNKKNAIDPFVAFGDKEIGHAITVAGQPMNSIEHTYIVKQGDSLWSIAKKSGASVEEIKAVNHLSHDDISLGQQLILPDELEDYTYIVQEGDTLTEISLKYNTTIDSLIQINRIDNQTIYPKQVLIIQKNK